MFPIPNQQIDGLKAIDTITPNLISWVHELQNQHHGQLLYCIPCAIKTFDKI